MRNIRLNDVSYLRRTDVSAVIEEDNLDFRAGMAVAKACISGSRQESYECFGVIGENYKELYDDSIKGNFGERNLMFLSYNRNIVRLSDNDFIVEVLCGDDGRSWTEIRHIKVIDGVPTLVNKNLGGCIKTSFDNLIIVGSGYRGYALYDVNKGITITPYLMSIKESYSRLFEVATKVDCDALGQTDYLFFRLNEKGELVSEVLSTIENDFIDFDGTLEELLVTRGAMALEKAQELAKKIDGFLENKEFVNKYFSLQRKKKN